jgi:regulator of sigma E protease
MTLVSYLVAGAVMISVLVVLHELGHFMVARYFGVGTPVFSVGMGPRLFGFQYRDTDFRVSALPIGGYVQMAGADPFGEEDADSWVDPRQDFMKRPVWQRLLIMLAGPAMNIALPFVLFTGVLMLGDAQLDNVIGRVSPGSAAHDAGVLEGDRLVEVNGEPVDVWNDLIDILDEPAAPVAMVVERSGQRRPIEIGAGILEVDPDGVVDVRSLGISHFPFSSRVGVERASPAWTAGLRPADAIVAVDGVDVDTFQELAHALGADGQHILSVKRAALAGDSDVQTLTLEMTSRTGEPWGVEPLELYVGLVVPDSAAGEAGLQTGDRLKAIDGVEMTTWQEVIDAVGATVEGLGEGESPRTIRLEVLRDGQPLELVFAPRVTRQLVMGEPIFRPVMGVKQFPDTYAVGDTIVKKYGFVDAFERAVDETALLFNGMRRLLGNMGTGRVKLTEGLGGPVAIVQAAGIAAEGGALEFIKMMGRISLGIGIINLLPVPVLDGGQILFYLIEGLRGRPLPLVLRERILMVGVLAVAALFLVLTVSDFGRVLAG